MTIFPSRGLLAQLATHRVSAAWVLVTTNMAQIHADIFVFFRRILIPILRARRLRRPGGKNSGWLPPIKSGFSDARLRPNRMSELTR
jgi:hypothetical protein